MYRSIFERLPDDELNVYDVSTDHRREIGSLGLRLEMVTRYSPGYKLIDPVDREVLEIWRYTNAAGFDGVMRSSGLRVRTIGENPKQHEITLNVDELMLFTKISFKSLGHTRSTSSLLSFTGDLLESERAQLDRHSSDLIALSLE